MKNNHMHVKKATFDSLNTELKKMLIEQLKAEILSNINTYLTNQGYKHNQGATKHPCMPLI
ncbi:hypothetical protein AwDysgo_05090 [Bacteroidales bacterium]|nr:hypothetical protein AwDysgo_05090 [Bacteroidales bacterium]